jgi:hypothetical protein
MTVVWHTTTSNAAEAILDYGFEAQPTSRGPGVSVSVNPIIAAALLRTAQRMNNFWDEDEVAEWFVEMGVGEEQVARARRSYEQQMERQPHNRWRDTPAGLYLSMMSRFHPAVGGPAEGIPRNEFLWADIGKNLINQEVVTVSALWTGSLPRNFTDEAIEAELFIKADELWELEPEFIYSDPNKLVRDAGL